MTLPAVVTTTQMGPSGDPAQARSELLAGLQAINTLRAHLATSTLTSGASVLAAAGGLAVSGTDLLTSFGFVAKSANYTALAGDRGKVINFTTAGVTLSLTAAGTLGDGWWCIVVNSASTGLVTIDPNGSETIDGSTTIALLPGQSCIVLCNGSLFRTAGRRIGGEMVRAHKGGTDQTGVANNVETLVTFSNTDTNDGDVFNLENERFTPLSGQRWLITSTVLLTSANDGMSLQLLLYKNGSVYRRGQQVRAPDSNSIGADAHWIVAADGDYFELYILITNSSATRTVEGDEVSTFFEAVRVG